MEASSIGRSCCAMTPCLYAVAQGMSCFPPQAGHSTSKIDSQTNESVVSPPGASKSTTESVFGHAILARTSFLLVANQILRAFVPARQYFIGSISDVHPPT